MSTVYTAKDIPKNIATSGVISFVLMYALIFFFLWLLPSPALLCENGELDLKQVALYSLWVWLALLVFALVAGAITSLVTPTPKCVLPASPAVTAPVAAPPAAPSAPAVVKMPELVAAAEPVAA